MFCLFISQLVDGDLICCQFGIMNNQCCYNISYKDIFYFVRENLDFLQLDLLSFLVFS